MPGPSLNPKPTGTQAVSLVAAAVAFAVIAGSIWSGYEVRALMASRD
jgi:hypothetical protein